MTDNLKQAVALVLEGFNLPADVRKILEAAYWTEPAGSAEPGNLPPLPKPEFMCSTVVPEDTPTYTAEQMKEYARAAMSTQSTHQPDVSIKAGESDIKRFEPEHGSTSTWDTVPPIKMAESDDGEWVRYADVVVLLAAKGGE